MKIYEEETSDKTQQPFMFKDTQGPRIQGILVFQQNKVVSGNAIRENKPYI